ncbi:MAG: hypothetical protein N3A55_06110 [Methylohalobius sp.]|nr:hypothetical protein [Methylohalobius sp.]
MWHLRRQKEETGRADVRRSNLNRLLATLPRAKGYYSMSVQLTRDEKAGVAVVLRVAKERPHGAPSAGF